MSNESVLLPFIDSLMNTIRKGHLDTVDLSSKYNEIKDNWHETLLHELDVSVTDNSSKNKNVK